MTITLVLVLLPNTSSWRNHSFLHRKAISDSINNESLAITLPTGTEGFTTQLTSDGIASQAVKTILFWSGFYTAPASRWTVKMGEFVCGQYRCRLTDDRSRYTVSDALMFHMRCPSYVKDMTTLAAERARPPNQRWVLYNRESASWMKGKDLIPANGLVNWTMGYRRDNDIYIPTAVIKKGQYQDGFDPNKNYMEGKPGHVAVLMSMCNWGGYKDRSNYINLLRRSGLHVDIHGNCGKKCGKDFETCAKALRTYKFVLAFENSLCDDYITEKAYKNGFRLGGIPIVMSKANVTDASILPPGSFINGLAFPNTAALIDHINKVGKDPALYNSYFEWRANWTFSFVSEDEGHVVFSNEYYCPLCEKLHSESGSKNIQNLQEWFEHEKCQPYPKH